MERKEAAEAKRARKLLLRLLALYPHVAPQALEGAIRAIKAEKALSEASTVVVDE